MQLLTISLPLQFTPNVRKRQFNLSSELNRVRGAVRYKLFTLAVCNKQVKPSVGKGTVYLGSD